MPLKIEIDSEKSDALRRILSIDSSDLRSIHDTMEKTITIKNLQKSSIIEVFDKHLNSNILELLLQNLVGLLRAKNEFDIDIKPFLDILESSLKDAGWSPDEISLLSSKSDLLGRMIISPLVTFILKLSTLSTDYSNIVVDTKILTESRPIFDKVRAEQIGSIITSKIFLHYYNFNMEKTKEFSLDYRQLLKLKTEINSAINKVSLLERSAPQGAFVSFIVGRDAND